MRWGARGTEGCREDGIRGRVDSREECRSSTHKLRDMRKRHSEKLEEVG